MRTLSRVLLVFCALLVLTLVVLIGFVKQPILFATSTAPVPVVDTAALERHVRFLSETVHPRDAAHTENLHAAATYIETALQATGAKVYSQEFSVQGTPYRNVLACFGPDAQANSCSPEDMPEEHLIVVGAHYDSFSDTPGADDNASGVAGLLELGRLLGENPPQKPVVLAAYTLEEPPYFRTRHMGSMVHAASLQATAVRPAAVIVLEMIGYFSEAPNTQQFPLPGLHLLYPSTGNFIALIGRFADASLTRRIKGSMQNAVTVPIYSMNALPHVTGIDFSDHASYWQYGYNAIMVTDTAFYRNTAYHTKNDTAQRLDYQRMAQVVQGVYAAIRDL